jgi:hypothetical protein
LSRSASAITRDRVMLYIIHGVYLIYQERLRRGRGGKLCHCVEAVGPRRERNYAKSRFPTAQGSVTLLFAQQTSCVGYRTSALLQMPPFQTLAIVYAHESQQARSRLLAGAAHPEEMAFTLM